MMAFFDHFALPMLHSMNAERAHNLTVFALEHFPLPAAPVDHPALALNVFGLDFPNPLGMAAGFDKDARVPSRAAATGLRLHRGRHADAAPAAGQRQAAPVSPARGSRRHQPLRLQQWRPRRRARKTAGASRAWRRRRRQYRRQQGRDRPRRRLCRGDRGFRRSRLLFHRQYLLAQHARACATCNRPRRSTTCWRG